MLHICILIPLLLRVPGSARASLPEPWVGIEDRKTDDSTAVQSLGVVCDSVKQQSGRGQKVLYPALS